MSVLDDPEAIATHDPSDFLGTVERFPEQISEALEIGASAESLPALEGIRSIAVLGMGGSGISGDFLETVLSERSEVFVRAIKGYALPRWVGPETLVFAASYSGNTEETLEAFDEARRRGSPIVCVSTGGKLGERAADAGLPLLRLPPGFKPRAALGYLSVPILIATRRIAGDEDMSDLDEAIGLIEKRSNEWGRAAPSDGNPAKRLAERLENHIPLVYGSEGPAALAAYRWKCQFNECSKVPAWSNSFPELNHNEIVGWGGMQDLTRDVFALIVLRDSRERTRISKRIEITVQLIDKSVAFVEEVEGSGTGVLARLLDLIYFGDFTATYLALVRGVDPAPVHVIEELKRELGG